MLPRIPAFWEHQINDTYNLLNGVREFQPLHDQVVWNIAYEVCTEHLPQQRAL